MSANGRQSVSVVIPSYERPEQLRRCLGSLTQSMSNLDEAIVVLRPADRASWLVVEQFDGHPSIVRPVPVHDTGFWSALMTGLAMAEKDLVAFLDDDALPMPHWVGALIGGFIDPSVGGFGGRILNFSDTRTDNHFIVAGPIARVDRRGVPRSQLHSWPAHHLVEDVDFLPGSNMAFRRQLLAGVNRYTLQGMAPANELVIACFVKAQGFRVVFDSNVLVEHHPGRRPEFPRGDKVGKAHSYAYSMTIALRTWPRLARTCNALLGSRVAPGLLSFPLCAARGPQVVRRWYAAQRGRRLAIRDLRKLARVSLAEG